MSDGKQIFKAHQDAIAQWTSVVTEHEVGMQRLLARASNSYTSKQELFSNKPIQIIRAKRVNEHAADIFPFDPAAPPNKELQRRSLVALCFVLTEINTLSRNIEDNDDQYDGNSSTIQQVAQRLLSLLQNLHLQLVGIVTSQQQVFQPLAAYGIIWRTLARGIASLVLLETRHKIVLLRQGLCFLQNHHSFVIEQACKVLKLWMQPAFTSHQVLECVCLFIYLSRATTPALKERERADWLKRFETLFSQVSPNLPLMRQRRCVRAEELLYENCLPEMKANRTEYFVSLRSAYTKTLLANFKPQALKLSQDAMFEHNKFQVALRIFHLVFNVLFTHVVSKQALPKDTLPTLLLCLDTLHELGKLDYLPASISKQGEDPFCLLPSSPNQVVQSTARAIAINLYFPEQSVESECDALRRYANICNTKTLFQSFPELFDPFFKLKLDLCEYESLQCLREAFPKSDLDDLLCKHLWTEVDSILRSRLVMRLSKPTNLVDLEQRKLAVQVLLASAPHHVKLRLEFDLASSWQALRTTGIDRTWDTYAEMQYLAKQYFGLDVYLDSTYSGVAQFDLLKQVQFNGEDDAPSFYSQFNYNFDFACFVERKRIGKQLQFVSVSTLKQSLDVLGQGALPTVINLIYQFLAQRFSQLSLVWQQVKRYRKSARAFKVFRFELALEQCTESKPIWAQMRTVVTEIGNAFGLVRNLGLASSTTQQEQDNIQLLVGVFSSSSLKEQLGGFFLLVPALCVEFVDSNLYSKEVKMGGGATATEVAAAVASSADDGFVLGLAALLAILKQDSLFDSIKFFAGVVQYFAEKSATAPAKSKVASVVDSSSATFKMRHRGLARQYELIMYRLANARICFRE